MSGFSLSTSDTRSAAGGGHGDHDEYHGQHQQAHQNVHAVGQQAHQLARGERAGHDHVRAQPAYDKYAGIYRGVHYRSVPGHDLLGADEHVVEVRAGLAEFLFSYFSRT
jgi:hypothetical protein